MVISTNIPKESKTWAFLASREFSKPELEIIENELNEFVKSWESHGTPLQGYYEILERRFILLAVDESNQIATGCSIDKSVAIIKKIEGLLNVNLTDKGLVAWETDDEIKTAHFTELKTKIDAGSIKPDTKIYNLAISTFGELSTNWKIKAKDSWVKRYFN